MPGPFFSNVFCLRAWLLTAFLAVSSAFGAVPCAEAQSSKKSAGSNAEYNRVLKEAMAEYERSNWTEARALFEAAHELQPNARTLRAIGMCAFEEKSYVMAISFLTQARADTRKPLTADQRKQVDDALWRAHEFVGQYALELAPEGAVTLRVDMHDPVILEGKLLLDPGSHQLTLSADGYRSQEQTVVARARENAVLKFQLLPPTPDAAVAAAPTSGQESAPVADPQKDATATKHGLTRQQRAGIAVAGVGLASLAVGIAFGVTAKNKHDDSGCGSSCETEAAKRLNDDARLAGNVSTAMFVVGGVALAAGAFLVFWKRDRPSQRSALRVIPTLSAQFAGVSARGRW